MRQLFCLHCRRRGKKTDNQPVHQTAYAALRPLVTGTLSRARDAMTKNIDKAGVQMKIRRELGFILNELLDEQLYRHCFVSGDEAWTLRYSYYSVAGFPDETVYSGHVLAKAKKKYARFIEAKQHRFAFCVRVRGRYLDDMDVVLNRDDEGEL